MEVNGHMSETLKISCGVFQGSILGPILLLCYINDIFNATNLATFLFADDTSCLAENNSLPDLITYVNGELNKLAVWFKANRMAVNVSKTNYIIFHTRGKQIDLDGLSVIFNSNDLDQQFPDPLLVQPVERIHDNNPNENMRYFKLLGIYFDEQLTFNKHIYHVCMKLSHANFMLQRVSNYLQYLQIAYEHCIFLFSIPTYFTVPQS